MIKGLYEAHLPVSNLANSTAFYQGLGLELAYKSSKVSFLWIEKGKSWLGLWECEQVELSYHPSIRHLAFRIDIDDMTHVQEWLKVKGIKVRKDFGIEPDQQPLVLENGINSHAAIYFNDPDGNSIELIAPLEIDGEKVFDKDSYKRYLEDRKNNREIELDRWMKKRGNII